MAVVESLNVVLSLTTGPFAKGAESAIKATKSLDDQLKLQIETFGKTAAETQEYILALKGVDAETIKSLKTQQQQLDALKEQEAARQAMVKAEQAAAIQVQKIRAANMSRGEQLTLSLRTAEEKYADEVRELNHLLKVGAINQQTFNRALEGAKAQLPQVEKQATRLQRAMNGLGGLRGGLGQLGVRLGLGGTFAGALGGFQFARFAKDSLREHAKDNRELQASLDDLDKTLLEVKKNFGAWLVDVGNANGVIQGFNEGLKKLSGGDIDTRQGLVNTGRLDTNQTGDMLRESLQEAMNARAALEAQHNPAVANLGLKRQFDLVNAEIEILERRLADLKESGLDTENVTSGFGQFLLKEAGKAFDAITPMAENFGNTLVDGLKEAGKQLNKFDSMMHEATEFAKDFAKAFDITQGQNPLAQFDRQAAELKRLLDRGFITDDVFNLALFDERQRLEQFAGLNDPIPSRVGGARRGSAEAFEKIAAFQDGTGNTVQRTLEETRDLIKEQLRLQREVAAKQRQEFDAVGTVDTKP